MNQRFVFTIDPHLAPVLTIEPSEGLIFKFLRVEALVICPTLLS